MPEVLTVRQPEPGGLLMARKRKEKRRKESVTSQSSVISNLTHRKEEGLGCLHLSQQAEETELNSALFPDLKISFGLGSCQNPPHQVSSCFLLQSFTLLVSEILKLRF